MEAMKKVWCWLGYCPNFQRFYFIFMASLCTRLWLELILNWPERSDEYNVVIYNDDNMKSFFNVKLQPLLKMLHLLTDLHNLCYLLDYLADTLCQNWKIHWILLAPGVLTLTLVLFFPLESSYFCYLGADGKFQNCSIKLSGRNSPFRLLSAQNRLFWGAWGGPRNFILFGILIFLLLRSPCKISKL